MAERKVFDAFIVRHFPDHSTLVKGWATWDGKKWDQLEIDTFTHPYLEECKAFAFSDVLIDISCEKD